MANTINVTKMNEIVDRAVVIKNTEEGNVIPSSSNECPNVTYVTTTEYNALLDTVNTLKQRVDELENKISK